MLNSNKDIDYMNAVTVEEPVIQEVAVVVRQAGEWVLNNDIPSLINKNKNYLKKVWKCKIE